MARKKTNKSDEVKTKTEEERSADFFAEEKAEYEKRMTLAAETDKANSDEDAEEKTDSDNSTENDSSESGDDQDENSEENKEGE